MDEQKKALVDAIPASGRIAYEELERSLRAAGKALLLQNFHPMRRAGEVKATIDPTDGKLYVSRA